MNEELRVRIRENPYTFRLLREESYFYRNLLRNETSILELEKLARKKYKEPFLDNLSNKISTIKTIIDVMK